MLKVVFLVLVIAAVVHSECSFVKNDDVYKDIHQGYECKVPTGRMFFGYDGNLVILDNTEKVLFTSNIINTEPCLLRFQNDGDLVIYQTAILDDAALGVVRLSFRWSSGTKGTGDRMVFQNDRNLVIFNKQNEAVWSTRTYPLDCVFVKKDNDDIEFPHGYECKVATGRLVFQNDGNVVIYDNSGKVHWETNTYSKDEKRSFRFQKDGNFVVYRPSYVVGRPYRVTPEKVIWSSETAGTGYRMVFQDDLNLVIFEKQNNSVWSANTGKPKCAFVKKDEDIEIPLGYECKVATGRLVFQTDGNVVIFDNSGNVLWSTNTYGKATNAYNKDEKRAFRFQKDGNFVVYRPSYVIGRPYRVVPEKVIWSSGTSGTGYRMVFQDDRNLVITDKQNKIVWATNTSQP